MRDDETPYSELPDNFRDTYARLMEGFSESTEYGAIQIVQLASAIREPGRFPDIDPRAAVLSSLVLGGYAADALALGLPLLRRPADGPLWMSILATAAVAAGHPTCVVDSGKCLGELYGYGIVELLTATAAVHVENERYSEAADVLDLTLECDLIPTILAPVSALQRIGLWAACRSRCHLPVLNVATMSLELPAELRVRCLSGIEAELLRVNERLIPDSTLRAAFAMTLMQWTLNELTSLSSHGDAVYALVEQSIERLLDRTPSA